ncbi:hypothetical protein CDAR_234591 [Caerostris darwini]|uniref:Uncharacterized protein n=1 Tax=Caerostris darwini TaxID=1538125 RepID=A0AAV4THX9_9ARAC|nr:hypothetical protein CDAR_234591 [Caerostris darwini]
MIYLYQQLYLPQPELDYLPTQWRRPLGALFIKKKGNTYKKTADNFKLPFERENQKGKRRATEQKSQISNVAEDITGIEKQQQRKEEKDGRDENPFPGAAFPL